MLILSFFPLGNKLLHRILASRCLVSVYHGICFPREGPLEEQEFELSFTGCIWVDLTIRCWYLGLGIPTAFNYKPRSWIWYCGLYMIILPYLSNSSDLRRGRRLYSGNPVSRISSASHILLHLILPQNIFTEHSFPWWLH